MASILKTVILQQIKVMPLMQSNNQIKLLNILDQTNKNKNLKVLRNTIKLIIKIVKVVA